MRKMRLGRTDLLISPVVFGGIINTDETQEDANSYVSLAVDAGVNYFDVAPSYGNAEVRLAPALKPYRQGVFLACKTTRRGILSLKNSEVTVEDAKGSPGYDQAIPSVAVASEKE